MKVLIWAGGLALAAFIGLAVLMRLAGPGEVLGMDAAVIERTGKPNDYLAAVPGTTSADVDRELSVRDLPAREHLFLFDAIARNAPRVSVKAGSVKEGRIVYVQRSLVFGFPDTILAEAVNLEGGSGLIVYSRSEFGHSDLGENKARIDAWLEALGD